MKKNELLNYYRSFSLNLVLLKRIYIFLATFITIPENSRRLWRGMGCSSNDVDLPFEINMILKDLNLFGRKELVKNIFFDF